MSNSCNQNSTLSNTAEIVENESRMILLGFYTSDPYDDEGVPILRITDIQKKYSALDGALGS